MTKIKSEENTCDKCHCIYYSDNLIWITAEDFEPFVGEQLSDDTYNKYDALCDKCYESELK